MTSHRLLVALVLVASTKLPAQLRPDDPEYRNPEMAVLLEILVPGGGHFYAGESKKGALLLGSSVAALGAGFAGTMASRDRCEREVGFDAFDRCVREGGLNWTPFAVGAATALAIRVYGLMSAGDAARRSNVRRQDALGRVPLRPVLATQRGGGTRFGFEVPLGL